MRNDQMAAKKKTTEVQDFEGALKRLEEIVERLEKGDVPLEKALDLYEEGIVLSKTCGELLTRAEMKLQRLGRDLQGNLRLFDQQEEPEE
jgi:exodeoxyribonuclease VII small subunit